LLQASGLVTWLMRVTSRVTRQVTCVTCLVTIIIILILVSSNGFTSQVTRLVFLLCTLSSLHPLGSPVPSTPAYCSPHDKCRSTCSPALHKRRIYQRDECGQPAGFTLTKHHRLQPGIYKTLFHFRALLCVNYPLPPPPQQQQSLPYCTTIAQYTPPH